MTDLPHLLRYVRANDVSRLDPTTIGHLSTWVSEGLSQLELDATATAGVDPEMDEEITGQAEELRAVEAKIREIRGVEKNDRGQANRYCAGRPASPLLSSQRQLTPPTPGGSIEGRIK